MFIWISLWFGLFWRFNCFNLELFFIILWCYKYGMVFFFVIVCIKDIWKLVLVIMFWSLVSYWLVDWGFCVWEVDVFCLFWFCLSCFWIMFFCIVFFWLVLFSWIVFVFDFELVFNLMLLLFMFWIGVIGVFVFLLVEVVWVVKGWIVVFEMKKSVRIEL